MTHRERLLGLISHKIADRVGWAPQTTGTFFTSISDYVSRFGTNDWLPSTPDLIEDELQYRVKTYEDVGADFLGWMPGLCSGGYDSTVKTNKVRQGNVITSEIITPIGTITEIKEVSDSACGVFTKKEFISEAGDIEIYKFATEHSHIKPDYERIDKESQIVGDNGILLASGPTSPIQRLELHGCKLSDLIYFLADYKKQMEELFSSMHKRAIKTADIAADSKHTVFLCGHVTGCGTLSPEIFDRYIKENIMDYHKILRRENKLIVSHASGENLFPLWNYMLDIDLDAIHGFSTKPEGNKNLYQVLKDYGSRITVWGGLDCHSLRHFTVSEVEEEVKRILDVVGKLRVPFILGSSDDLVTGTPLRNLEAVSKMVGKYGKY